MLRLTIEIVPYGIETKKRHITTLEIARTTLHENPETYIVRAYKADGELTNTFQVKDHYYEDGANELCRLALESLVMPELRS